MCLAIIQAKEHALSPLSLKASLYIVSRTEQSLIQKQAASLTWIDILRIFWLAQDSSVKLEARSLSLEAWHTEEKRREENAKTTVKRRLTIMRLTSFPSLKGRQTRTEPRRLQRTCLLSKTWSTPTVPAKRKGSSIENTSALHVINVMGANHQKTTQEEAKHIYTNSANIIHHIYRRPKFKQAMIG